MIAFIKLSVKEESTGIGGSGLAPKIKESSASSPVEGDRQSPVVTGKKKGADAFKCLLNGKLISMPYKPFWFNVQAVDNFSELFLSFMERQHHFFESKNLVRRPDLVLNHSLAFRRQPPYVGAETTYVNETAWGHAEEILKSGFDFDQIHWDWEDLPGKGVWCLEGGASSHRSLKDSLYWGPSLTLRLKDDVTVFTLRDFNKVKDWLDGEISSAPHRSYVIENQNEYFGFLFDLSCRYCGVDIIKTSEGYFIIKNPGSIKSITLGNLNPYAVPRNSIYPVSEGMEKIRSEKCDPLLTGVVENAESLARDGHIDLAIMLYKEAESAWKELAVDFKSRGREDDHKFYYQAVVVVERRVLELEQSKAQNIGRVVTGASADRVPGSASSPVKDDKQFTAKAGKFKISLEAVRNMLMILDTIKRSGLTEIDVVDTRWSSNQKKSLTVDQAEKMVSAGKLFLRKDGWLYLSNKILVPVFSGGIFIQDVHVYSRTDKMAQGRDWLKAEIQSSGLLQKDDDLDNENQLRVILLGAMMEFCLFNECSALLEKIRKDRKYEYSISRENQLELLIPFDLIRWDLRLSNRKMMRNYFVLEDTEYTSYLRMLNILGITHVIFGPDGKILTQKVNDVSDEAQAVIRFFNTKEDLMKFVSGKNEDTASSPVEGSARGFVTVIIDGVRYERLIEDATKLKDVFVTIEHESVNALELVQNTKDAAIFMDFDEYVLESLAFPGDVFTVICSSSPVAVNLVLIPWQGVAIVPGRMKIEMKKRIDVIVAPVEENLVSEKVLYLFWKVWSLGDYLRNFLENLFEALRELLEGISTMLKRIAIVLIPQRVIVMPIVIANDSEAIFSFRLPRRVAPRNDIGSAMTSEENQEASVGAVVVASSSPVINRGGGLTQAKIESFASMLDPDIGGYKITVEYLAKQFVKGGPWDGQVDMVASSPLWTDVVDKVNGETNGFTEIAQAVEPRTSLLMPGVNPVYDAPLTLK